MQFGAQAIGRVAGEQGETLLGGARGHGELAEAIGVLRDQVPGVSLQLGVGARDRRRERLACDTLAFFVVALFEKGTRTGERLTDIEAVCHGEKGGIWDHCGWSGTSTLHRRVRMKLEDRAFAVQWLCVDRNG